MEGSEVRSSPQESRGNDSREFEKGAPLNLTFILLMCLKMLYKAC